jgi:peptide/nickel transport system substrate-binding protein
VVDDLTIRFTLAQRAADFLNVLSVPYAGIISPESSGPSSGLLVGAGPFMVAEWERGQSLALRASASYCWGPELTENRAAPHIENLIFKVIPDAAAQVAALEAGEVDVIAIDQTDEWLALQKNPSVQLIEIPQTASLDPLWQSISRPGKGLAVGKKVLNVKIGYAGQMLANDIRVEENKK